MIEEITTTDEGLAKSGTRPHQPFDTELQGELDRAEFAGEDRTIEGEIIGTGEWADGEPITLQVWTPVGDPDVFTEELEVPTANDPLAVSKFGRILEAHGYSRSSANHLIGDEVECSYDGEWRIVEPGLVGNTIDDNTDSTTPDSSADDDFLAQFWQRLKHIPTDIRDGLSADEQLAIHLASFSGLCVLALVSGASGARFSRGFLLLGVYFMMWCLIAGPRFECGVEETAFFYRGCRIVTVTTIYDDLYSGPRAAGRRMRLTSDADRQRFRRIVARAYPDGGPVLSIEDEQVVRREFGLLSPLTGNYQHSHSTDDHRSMVEERMKRKIDRQRHNAGVEDVSQ